jgi:hypothetical protein
MRTSHATAGVGCELSQRGKALLYQRDVVLLTLVVLNSFKLCEVRTAFLNTSCLSILAGHPSGKLACCWLASLRAASWLQAGQELAALADHMLTVCSPLVAAVGPEHQQQ